MPRQVERGVFETTEIQRLAKTSPWITNVFVDDKLLYEYIRDAVNDVKDKDPPYNPYLYESLMADVSAALDRCLAYRRECAGLESQAVNRALEYELFQKTSNTDALLNALLTDTSSLSEAQKGQDQTGKALAKVSDNLKNLAPAYTGAAKATGKAIENEDKKRKALGERLKSLTDYQEALQRRHTTTGHALNYGERRDRVIQLITQEIKEAYQKAIAARAGLITQLGLTESKDYAFPVPVGKDSDSDLLDRFVLWARDMIRSYEIYSEDEITFEMVVPLGSPYYNDFQSPQNERHFYTHDQLKGELSSNSRTGGLLTINLKDAFPAVLRANAAEKYEPNVRLRGIGLSAGTTKEIDPTYSWSGVIVLPTQPTPYESVSLPGASVDRDRSSRVITRPPVVLGRIFPYRFDATPALSSGEEVWNADPGAGPTLIYIQLMARGGAGYLDKPRGYDFIEDLKLHLRLAARPNRDVTEWQKGPLPTSLRGE